MMLSRHSRRLGATNDPRCPGDRPAHQDGSGDAEPDRGHQERWDRLDRDRDAEVGRAPDDVEDQQPEPDRPASWARAGARLA